MKCFWNMSFNYSAIYMYFKSGRNLPRVLDKSSEAKEIWWRTIMMFKELLPRESISPIFLNRISLFYLLLIGDPFNYLQLNHLDTNKRFFEYNH